MNAPDQPSRMKFWLVRIGYTIGAIVALILIIISFVYGATVSPETRASVHVGDRPGPVHSVFR